VAVLARKSEFNDRGLLMSTVPKLKQQNKYDRHSCISLYVP
jgi:hypothetical protein